MTTAAVVALIVRYGLVLLFLPFSALDKIFGFNHAVKQAQSMFKPRPVAIAMILIGLFVEVFARSGSSLASPIAPVLSSSPATVRPRRSFTSNSGHRATSGRP